MLAGLPLLTGCASSSRLAAAIDANDPRRIESAILAGESPNSKVAINTSALEYAAKFGNEDVIRELVKRGADINRGYEVGASGPYTPLFRVLQRTDGRPRIAKLLLELGAKVDPYSLDLIRGPYAPQAFVDMIEAAYARQSGLKSSPVPQLPPGNLDDGAYARMLASATPSPEKKDAASDVDSPSRRGAERPHDFALVVGIEEYQSVPKADFGIRDAKTVRKHLEALGFPPRNIISLEGSQATGSKLRSYLEEWLPLNVKADSTLFVYYSGHGAPDIKTGDAYLVPWDGDPKFLKSTALPLTKLYSDLAKTKAKRVIVALDACFSGAGGRSVLAKGARPLVAKIADTAPIGGNITVLAAASGDEITGSLDEQGHGMFTYYLLKGLEADPKASAKSLFGYLLPRVQDEARRQNRVQTPVLAGAAAGPLLP